MARHKSTRTPLSAAEKQRRYRARRDADEQKRQQYLEKERERWWKDAETGKKKRQKDRSEREKRVQRKKWKEAHKRCKARKSVLQGFHTPPQTPESPISPTPGTSSLSSSSLMDVDSGGSPAPARAPAPAPALGQSYTCCWDLCQLQFPSSPDLAEHIRDRHVDSQTGGMFVCLWKGCKVYNTPSTSQSWLQRHMLSHSGDKPFKCVVGGCNATFASQGGLARHVPTHFSFESSKVSGHGKVKEESPSKAGLNKRRKQRNKQRRSLPRPHDFFDAQTMDAIRHRAICLNLATHIESLGSGHSVVFDSTVIARRREDSGKVKVLLHWTPEDILPDVWVNESERLQQKTKVVHLSKLPTDTAVLLDPNIYRMFF